MSIARDGKKGDLLKVNNSKIIIAPSILAADLSNLCYEVKRSEEGDADMIHLDVIDGHFAPNITFGADTIKALRKCTTLDFDAHLMIAEPLKYVERFINAGCNIVTVHVEVCNDRIFRDIASILKRSNVKVGVALNPDTSIPPWLLEHMKNDTIDVINVMSVYPGFSGQRFIPSILQKMSNIYNNIIKANNLHTLIEADGGIDHSNVYDVVRAGARIIVAGNSIYSNDDITYAIKMLRENAVRGMDRYE